MPLSTPANTPHLGARDSIQAIDEQIKEHEKAGEHEKAIIRLKRTRNSLLNVSKLPPEVLGEIFCWNATFKGRFGGLEERSHNFLLVCHHWFEVASCTPEIWIFWGNVLKDWARRCPYSRTAPLDLVLDGDAGDGDRPDAALYNELQDRAIRDTIRRVHLKANSSELLSSIISSLTAKCEGTRTNSVESFVLYNWGSSPVDISDFFAHYQFPKLRRLDTVECTISLWDQLTLRTGALTVLGLHLRFSSHTPTMSQLLSILSSNPLLQKIALNGRVIPQDDGDTSPVRVPLHNLKELELDGSPQNVIKLLHRLDHPRRMDGLTLTLDRCSVMEISQLLGPYLRGYIRGRGRSQYGLGLNVFFSETLGLHVGDVQGVNPLLRPMNSFLTISVAPNEPHHENARGRAIFDLIMYVPKEEFTHFKTSGNCVTMGNIYPLFPNLRALSFADMRLSAAFPEPDPGRDKEILLFLQHIFLQYPSVDNNNWSPLVTFLACRRRTSFGNRLSTLEISGSPHMYPEVMETVGGMVRKFTIRYLVPSWYFFQ